jgi:hypothetical protein
VTPKQLALHALEKHRGHETERIERMYRGMSADQLELEHALSGKTRKQVLFENRQRDTEIKAAIDWVNSQPVIEHFEALEAEINQLRQLVVNADAVSRARFEYYGLCDCIDNAGSPYPSQWAADIIERSKQTHSPEGNSAKHSG